MDEGRSDDWDENDPPGWFADLLKGDPNNCFDDEDLQERFIARKWIELCSVPASLRSVFVANYHQALLQAQREQVRVALEESVQATQQLQRLESPKRS